MLNRLTTHPHLFWVVIQSTRHGFQYLEDEALTKTRRQRTKLTGKISDAVNAIADHFLEVWIRAALAQREDRQPPSGVTNTSPIPGICSYGSRIPFDVWCGGMRVLH